jgi:hypothetical protein
MIMPSQCSVYKWSGKRERQVNVPPLVIVRASQWQHFWPGSKIKTGLSGSNIPPLLGKSRDISSAIYEIKLHIKRQL